MGRKRWQWFNFRIGKKKLVAGVRRGKSNKAGEKKPSVVDPSQEKGGPVYSIRKEKRHYRSYFLFEKGKKGQKKEKNYNLTSKKRRLNLYGGEAIIPEEGGPKKEKKRVGTAQKKKKGRCPPKRQPALVRPGGKDQNQGEKKRGQRCSPKKKGRTLKRKKWTT